MKLYSILRPYLLIIAVVLVSTFVLWLPFLLKLNGLNFLDIYKHYDGALYIIPAKTFYEVSKIDVPGVGFILSLPLSPIYFAAHLPLFPIFIRIFYLGFGYLKSMTKVGASIATASLFFIKSIFFCSSIFHLLFKTYFC